MTDELSHPERVAIARLHAMLELLPAALDKRLAPAGITSFEYTLLEPLAESPDGRLRLSALAQRTNASISRISRVATSLEKRGLIERAPCEADGRATNAVLTTAGRTAYQHSRGLYAAAVRQLVLDGLAPGPAGVDALATLALGVLGRLDPAAAAAPPAPSASAPSASAPLCAADPAPSL